MRPSDEMEADYFRAWADSGPTLSCALWGDQDSPGSTENGHGDGLERAQKRKLRQVAELAGVRPGMDVLDVGCGFGGMLHHLVDQAGARSAHGIEPSALMCEEIRRRNLPDVTVDCVDHTRFRPPRRFDAVTCVSAMEYLGDVRSMDQSGEVRGLRDSFSRVYEWTVPSACFGLEVVLTGPTGLDAETATAGREMLEDMPALPGKPPSLPNLLTAADGLWELLSVRTHRQDWIRTLNEWAARLTRNRDTISARWGPDSTERTLRYLSLEQETFATGQLTMAHLSFRRY